MIMRQRMKQIQLPDDKSAKIELLKHILFGALIEFNETLEVIRSNTPTICPTYVIIDAIHRPDITVLFEGYNLDWRCLWKGESAEKFALHAPYIAQLKEDNEFTDWLLSQGFGKGWGIFLRSYYSINELTNHLRKFNQVYSDVDKIWLMFRYYSPVAIKQVLPYLPGNDFIDFMRQINQLMSEVSEKSLMIIR